MNSLPSALCSIEGTKKPQNLTIEQLKYIIDKLLVGMSGYTITSAPDGTTSPTFDEDKWKTFVSLYNNPNITIKKEVKAQYIAALTSIIKQKQKQEQEQEHITDKTLADIKTNLTAELTYDNDPYTKLYKAQYEIAQKINQKIEEEKEKNDSFNASKALDKYKINPHTTFLGDGMITTGTMHNVTAFMSDTEGNIKILNKDDPYRKFKKIGNYFVGTKTSNTPGKGGEVIAADIFDTTGNKISTATGYIEIETINNKTYYSEHHTLDNKGNPTLYNLRNDKMEIIISDIPKDINIKTISADMINTRDIPTNRTGTFYHFDENNKNQRRDDIKKGSFVPSEDQIQVYEGLHDTKNDTENDTENLPKKQILGESNQKQPLYSIDKDNDGNVVCIYNAQRNIIWNKSNNPAVTAQITNQSFSKNLVCIEETNTTSDILQKVIILNVTSGKKYEFTGNLDSIRTQGNVFVVGDIVYNSDYEPLGTTNKGIASQITNEKKKTQFVNTDTGTLVPQEFDEILHVLTNDEGELVYIVLNDNNVTSIEIKN